MSFCDMTIEDITKSVKNGSIKAVSLVEEAFLKIEEMEPKVEAYLTLCKDEALEKAKEVDRKAAAGEKLGLLAGVPIAIKDNICTDGIKTTCASKMLEDFIPPYDATVIKKLKEQDAIIIGKTNMDEFAMGSSTENSAFKKTKNPWNYARVPGGSSGGSAAAVGANTVPVALGSDTGGSIRQPASFCGVVGLKPTYGLVSRFGLIAFGSSLDQIGPVTRCVRDNALCLSVIQGEDALDGTSYKGSITEDYLKDIDKGVEDLRIGVPEEFFSEGLDEEIKSAVSRSINMYKELGAKVETFSLPILKEGLSAYYVVSSAEASSNLARFDGIRYGYRPENFESVDELMERSRTEAFGQEVKRRIMLGTYVLSSGYYDAYYKRALKLKKKIKDSFKEAFTKYDILLSPTSPILPFKCGEKVDNPLEMYLADIYTININLAGLPAMSLPCGFSKEGLPIGIQLIGNDFAENTIFKAGYALEQRLK